MTVKKKKQMKEIPHVTASIMFEKWYTKGITFKSVPSAGVKNNFKQRPVRVNKSSRSLADNIRTLLNFRHNRIKTHLTRIREARA